MAESSSLKDMIYDNVFSSIIQGEYAANDVISEKKLMEKYQVSKSPVREALGKLCSEGVLKSMPRFGYVVVELTGTDIENILKFRLVLEGGSLRECIHQIRPEQVERLKQIDLLCENEEAQDDFWIHWEHNMEFHLTLISFSGNQFSHQMLKQSLDTLTRAYAQFYWDKWKVITFPTDTRYHANIIACLENQDVEGAIHFLRQDIGDFGR